MIIKEDQELAKTGHKVQLVPRIETSDLIKAICKDDPVRSVPEYQRLLNMSWEEYEEEMKKAGT